MEVNMHQISPSNLKREIKLNMRAQLNTMVWGGPGIGKSDIPQQVADELDMNLIDFRANLFDPVDVRGIPRVVKVVNTEKYYTKWAVPDVFPIEARDGKNGILFIDELPTAPPATQNAFLQLLLTRQVGDYVLPDGWSIMAAGNRITDAAAVYQMPSPVRNRLAHYELTPNHDDWCDWAIQNKIDPSLISFIRYRTNLLYDFNADEYAFPTPRAWSFVDKKLKVIPENYDNDDLFYGVASLVGDGPAGEFVAFKSVADQLPDIDNLIENPSTYKHDSNPAVLYALTGAIGSRASDDNMENIMKLCNKLEREYQVILVKNCLAVDRELLKHPACSNWISENASAIL